MHRTTLAAFWLTGTLLSFSALAVAGRELHGVLSISVILLARSLAGLALAGLWSAGSRRRSLAAPRGAMPMLLLRNLAHWAASYCWFAGVALLPLAEVFAIEFTMPIWAAILATIFLQERLGRARAAGILIGVAGALLIVRPGTAVFDPASLIVLLAAIGFAVSLVSTRRIMGSISVVTFIFYMSLLQLPLGIVTAAVDWTPVTLASLPWLAVASLAGLTAHFCLAKALALAEATLVAPMDILRLPLIAMVGAAFYGESLDIWVVAGAALACIGNWINLRSVRTT